MGAALKAAPAKKLLKLDIGCGPNKREGFLGVDQFAMKGVDKVFDVRKTPWPWKDSSVEEVHCSHFLEHLTANERCAFMNELARVLIPGGKATIIVPHWCSNRAYGDPTHMWPPVSEMFFFYLEREWRMNNAPHADVKFNKNGYSCDFKATWVYGMHPLLTPKNQDYQQHALTFFKEAAQDTHATLENRK